MSGYAKDIKGVLEDCERYIPVCVAYDGAICKPNQSDLVFVAIARDAITEYCHLRNIKLRVSKPPTKGASYWEHEW